MSAPEAAEGRKSIGARRNPETEQAILDAAEAILAEKGPGGFSIEAVARRARAGKPTIYRWWPNRSRLLLAVYHRQKRIPHDFDTGSVEKDVAGFLESLLAHWRDTPGGQVFRSIIAEAQSNAAAAEALHAYSVERHDQTASIFRRAMARGEIRADVDPVLAAEMVASFARGRLLTGQLELGPEERDACARQIVRGLKP